jgi:hypothetical protein
MDAGKVPDRSGKSLDKSKKKQALHVVVKNYLYLCERIVKIFIKLQSL